MTDQKFYQNIFSENPKVKEKFQKYLKERNKKKELQIFVLNNKLISGYNCPTYFINFDLTYGLFDDFFWEHDIKLIDFLNGYITLHTTIYGDDNFKKNDYKKSQQQAILKVCETLEQKLNKLPVKTINLFHTDFLEQELK